MTEGHGDEIVLANELIGRLKGKQLIQFRMGYGVHLEFGSDNEVTIETSLGVVDRPTRWSGEPLTAEAAWALLPLNLSEVTLAKIGRDGALDLGFA